MPHYLNASWHISDKVINDNVSKLITLPSRLITVIIFVLMWLYSLKKNTNQRLSHIQTHQKFSLLNLITAPRIQMKSFDILKLPVLSNIGQKEVNKKRGGYTENWQ